MTGHNLKFCRRMLAALVVAPGLWAAPALAQEPCNPILHGTYCAQDKRPIPTGDWDNKRSFEPMRGPGSDMFPQQVPTGTLGGITFNKSSNCIALLRRSACSGD